MAWNDASLSCISRAGLGFTGLLPAAPRKSPMTAMSGLNTLDRADAPPQTGKALEGQTPRASSRARGTRGNRRARLLGGGCGATLERGETRLQVGEAGLISLSPGLELLPEQSELLRHLGGLGRRHPLLRGEPKRREQPGRGEDAKQNQPLTSSHFPLP